MDPRNLDGMQNMSQPETADELSQFIHCTQWMSQCIPDFAARVQPLRNTLELAYARAGRRTTKAVAKIKLSDVSWGKEQIEALHSMQGILLNVVSLAHFDHKKSVCVHTDASQQHWASVVTQCHRRELRLEQGNQQHTPLAFLGSDFTGASRDWSTI